MKILIAVLVIFAWLSLITVIHVNETDHSENQEKRKAGNDGQYKQHQCHDHQQAGELVHAISACHKAPCPFAHAIKERIHSISLHLK